MKSFIKLFVLATLPILCVAQNAEKGIQWVNGLSFEQVKQKAKAENRYIFIDCYTTWCGPCKMMDNSTYKEDSVGDFMNPKFLNVRLQMDQTAKDDPSVKAWYEDAKKIARKYRIEGYPTFIFLNPEGEIVHKDMGLMDTKKFIVMGQLALKPGKTYVNPFERYYALLDRVDNGDIPYDSLPAMIRVAAQLQNEERYSSLLKMHVDYMKRIPVEKRIVKQNVDFWQGMPFKANSDLYKLVYENRAAINEFKKYALGDEMIDRSILMSEVTPFLENQAKGSGVAVSGYYASGPSDKANLQEANWKHLEKQLTGKYPKTLVARAMLNAKIEWYKRHKNLDKWFALEFEWLDKYQLDLANFPYGNRINNVGWDVFMNTMDQKYIAKAIQWCEKSLKLRPKDMQLQDTYANLLYKVGRVDEAIAAEENAVTYAIQGFGDGYKKVVTQMKNGEKTYVREGAKWN